MEEMKVTRSRKLELRAETGEASSEELNLLRIIKLYNKLHNKARFFEMTGLTSSTFKNIIDGKGSPTAKTLFKIAKYFNVPTGSLFNDYQTWKGSDKHHVFGETFEHCLKLDGALLFFNDAEKL